MPTAIVQTYRPTSPVFTLPRFTSRLSSPGFHLQVCRSRFYSSRFTSPGFTSLYFHLQDYVSRCTAPDCHLQIYNSRFISPGLGLQIYISRCKFPGLSSPGLHLQVLHPDFHLHALLVIVSTDLIPILYPFPFFRYLKCS